MKDFNDTRKDKFLYLFLPGLIGWISGGAFLFFKVHLVVKVLVLLATVPFVLGLLERIDLKSYFKDNFKNELMFRNLVWFWNAGVILLVLSFHTGQPT